MMRMRLPLFAGVAAISVLMGSMSVSASTALPSVTVDRVDPRDEFGGGGDVSASIVGGTQISITDAPWQILLVDFDPGYWQSAIGQDYFAFCGGSIINQLWIVTAAHCVDDTSGWPYLRIAAGVTAKGGIASASLVDVVDVLVHEQWNSNTSENDVALLELAAPLDLSGSTRRAIDLPVAVGGDWPPLGTNAFITGWGTTTYEGSTPEQLRGATIQVLASPGAGTCGFYFGSYKPASMLCAGVTGGGKDTCQGDSGGPLAVMVNQRWTLAGITSWGSGCADANFPGLYTRVTSYLEWITRRSTLTPGAPTISSIESGNRVLRVSIVAPEGSSQWPVSNYAYSIDGGSWTTLRPASTANPIVISRLTNGRSYSVRVAAINGQGRGAASEAVAGTPLPDLPSAPTIRSVTPGDSSLQISYRAPANNGGALITGYEYSVNSGETWSVASAGSRSTLLISGLTNGSPVTVSIRAVNARGGGAPSVSAVVTPRRVPDAPAITGSSRASTTASIAFTAPAFDGGATITTYEYSLNGGRWTARRPASVSSPLVISGLTDNRSYSVRIRAVNAAGRGAASDPIVIDPLGLG